MKLIGNIVFGHDNGGRFFQDAPSSVLCKNCQACQDMDYSPSTLKIETFYDLSQTQDNRLICSERAKDFFLERFDVRISEIAAWRGRALYYVRPKLSVPFNALSRGTRFVDHCEVCGCYKSIVGATPAHLAVQDLNEKCFLKSDMTFGSYEEKAALNVVGLETAKEMQAQGFSGCVFKEAFSSIFVGDVDGSA